MIFFFVFVLYSSYGTFKMTFLNLNFKLCYLFFQMKMPICFSCFVIVQNQLVYVEKFVVI